GTPSRNTGSVDADCTSATISGNVVSEVIIHAAATSFIHTQTLAVNVADHSMRKAEWRSGAKAPLRVLSARAVSGIVPLAHQSASWNAASRLPLIPGKITVMI